MKAVIYMPGLGTSFTDQSVETFAQRYAKAIDINDPEVKKKYSLKFRDEKFGTDGSLNTKVATIVEEIDNKKNDILDVYEFRYIDELTEGFKQQNVFTKILNLFTIIIGHLPKVLFYTIRRFFIRRGGISEGSSGQFLYAAVILLILAFSGIILIAAFPATLGDMLEVKNNQALSNFLSNTYFGNFIDWSYTKVRGGAEYMIGFFALFYLLMPNFKIFILEMATEFICMIKYFSIGKNRLNLIGKFEEILEHVAESEYDYQGVEVIAYSFGSVVAIDTIFPMKGATSTRVAEKLDRLVTIGCPFDFINLYWKRYYEDREYKSSTIESWHNVYSTTDILSSNFRLDKEEGEAQRSVIPGAIVPVNIPFNVLSKDRYNPVRFFMLAGIKAHGMYWEDQVNSASCFTSLIAHQQPTT